eukprot:3773082-Pleurochrysis_carterae.AAC.10
MRTHTSKAVCSTGADMTEAALSGAIINGADFSDAVLNGATLIGLYKAAAVNFDRARFAYTAITNSWLTACSFVETDFQVRSGACEERNGRLREAKVTATQTPSGGVGGG